MTHTPASASFIACQLLRHRPCRGGRYWCHLRRCQGRAAVRLTSVFTPFLLFNEVFYHGSSSLSSVASLCISIHIYIYGTCSPNKLFEAVPGCVVVRHLLSFFARLHRSWSSSARSCTLGNFWCVYIYVYTYIYIANACKCCLSNNSFVFSIHLYTQFVGHIIGHINSVNSLKSCFVWNYGRTLLSFDGSASFPYGHMARVYPYSS